MGLAGTGSGSGADTVSSITTPTQGTISFWLRPQRLSGTQRFLGHSDEFEGLILGSTFYPQWGAGGGTDITFTLSVGTLYHMAQTWNLSTAFGELYVDGASEATDATDYNDSSAGTPDMFSRSGNNAFEADLHDIRIYNRVLSAAEVLTIYNSRGKDSIVHGMIHRWVLDEGADGSTFAGTAPGKDRAQNQNNYEPDTSPPSYLYDANITPRRR